MSICHFTAPIPTRKTLDNQERVSQAWHQDGNSPAWLDPEWYNYWRKIWQITKDVYEGLIDPEIRRMYLHQKGGEHSDTYEFRLHTSHLDNYFKEAVDSHAGLLSKFEVLEETPSIIADNLDDVDGCGNDLKTFLLNKDVGILRDFCGLITLDMPRVADPEGMRSERKPVLAGVEVEDIYAPIVENENGRWTLKQVTVHRQRQEVEGDFGSKIVDEFLVYTPGLVTVYEPLLGEAGATLKALDEIPIVGANGLPLTTLPVVWYAAQGDKPMEPKEPPFFSLLQMNLKHMNKVSELDKTESKVNTITLTREHPGEIPVSPSSVKLGPDGILEHEEGMKYGLLEAKGQGLALTQLRIEKLEEKMLKISHSFLGDRTQAATATEAKLDEGKTKLTLGTIAARKESAIQEVFKIWMAFVDPNFNPETDEVGGIKVSDEAVKVPPSAQEINALNTALEKGHVTRRYYLLKMRDWAFSPEGVDIEEELAELNRMEAERKNAALKIAQQQAQTDPEQESEDNPTTEPESENN